MKALLNKKRLKKYANGGQFNLNDPFSRTTPYLTTQFKRGQPVIVDPSYQLAPELLYQDSLSKAQKESKELLDTTKVDEALAKYQAHSGVTDEVMKKYRDTATAYKNKIIQDPFWAFNSSEAIQMRNQISNLLNDGMVKQKVQEYKDNTTKFTKAKEKGTDYYFAFADNSGSMYFKDPTTKEVKIVSKEQAASIQDKIKQQGGNIEDYFLTSQDEAFKFYDKNDNLSNTRGLYLNTQNAEDAITNIQKKFTNLGLVSIDSKNPIPLNLQNDVLDLGNGKDAFISLYETRNKVNRNYAQVDAIANSLKQGNLINADDQNAIIQDLMSRKKLTYREASNEFIDIIQAIATGKKKSEILNEFNRDTKTIDSPYAGAGGGGSNPIANVGPFAYAGTYASEKTEIPIMYGDVSKSGNVYNNLLGVKIATATNTTTNDKEGVGRGLKGNRAFLVDGTEIKDGTDNMKINDAYVVWGPSKQVNGTWILDVKRANDPKVKEISNKINQFIVENKDKMSPSDLALATERFALETSTKAYGSNVVFKPSIVIQGIKAATQNTVFQKPNGEEIVGFNMGNAKDHIFNPKNPLGKPTDLPFELQAKIKKQDETQDITSPVWYDNVIMGLGDEGYTQAIESVFISPTDFASLVYMDKLGFGTSTPNVEREAYNIVSLSETSYPPTNAQNPAIQQNNINYNPFKNR